MTLDWNFDFETERIEILLSSIEEAPYISKMKI